MKTFIDYLLEQEQFDYSTQRNILRGLHSRWNTLGADGKHPMRANGRFENISPEEMTTYKNMVETVKKRLIQELNGPLKDGWLKYVDYEKRNKSIMLRFAVGVKPAGNIKDGGPNTPVKEDTQGFLYVPTELYNALYWRNLVKDAEGAFKQNDIQSLNQLLPKFSHYFKNI